jgi:heat shock protein HslJ
MLRRMLLRLATALLALAVLGGCGSGDEQPAQASSLPLAGTPWMVSSGIDVPGWEQVKPSATFAEGKMAGFGGCNRYSASATVDGSALILGTAATTKMACGSPATEVEQAFHTALEDVAAFRIDGDELVLLDGDDGEVLGFTAATPVGSWEVTSFLQGDAISTLIPDTEITAVFAEGGKLTGSAGCNEYSSTFTLVPFAIEPPSATEKACETPPGVMEQEQAWLQALPKAASYTVDGTALTLLTREGTIVATLVATS